MPSRTLLPVVQMKTGSGHEAVRLVQGDDERSHEARGEAHVVQAEPHVGLEELRRGGREDEPDGEAGDDGERQAERQRDGSC